MCMNGKYFLRYCLIFLLATPTFSINPKGTSKIGSPCKPEKYKKYILPFQRAVLTDSAYAASPDIIRDYNEDKATDPNIDKLLCDTRGHPMAFQTHLQCDDNTNSCVCLAISDLRINTEQIIGTTGCLAIPGSWCQEDSYKLTCGYGNRCITNRCSDPRKSRGAATKAFTCNQFVILLLATMYIAIFSGIVSIP